MAVSNEEVAVRLSATGGSATAAEVGRVRAAVSSLERDTRSVTTSTRNWSGAYRELQGPMASVNRLVDRGAVGLTALTGGAVTWGLRTASSYELSRSALGALLGDVSKGNQLFRELQSYNLEAPFNFAQIASAEQTLLQFGVSGDKALTVLKGLGDVAAMTADPSNNLQSMALALGQISSAGVMRAQDLNQLVQAGFPAYQLLSEITGKTSAQLRKEMETGLTVPADAFVDAVDKMQGQVLARYRGGAKKQNDTLYGQWSNFKDMLARDLASGLESSIPDIKTQLPALSAAIGDLVREVGPQIPGLIDSMIRLTPAAVSLANSLADVATVLAKASASTADVLGPDGVKTIVEAYLAYRFGIKPISRIVKGARGPAAAVSETGTLADIASGTKSVLTREGGRIGAVAKWLGPLEIAALGKAAYRTRPGFLGGDLDEKTAGLPWYGHLGYQLGITDGVDTDSRAPSAKGTASPKPQKNVHLYGDVNIVEPTSDIDVANAFEYWVREREGRD